MNALEFTKSIYLGDRGCNSIIIDCRNSTVKFEIDIISRIRSSSGNWEFFNDENVENGRIVLESVTSMIWSSNGFLPNDYIISLEAKKSAAENSFDFLFIIVGQDQGNHDEISISIVAKGIHIETQDGRKITG